jgi:hypothetical protein
LLTDRSPDRHPSGNAEVLPLPLSTSRESPASRRCHPRTSVLCVPGALGVYKRFQTPSAQCAQRTAFVVNGLVAGSSPIRRRGSRSTPSRRRANLQPRGTATPERPSSAFPAPSAFTRDFKRRARSAHRERHLLLTDWSPDRHPSGDAEVVLHPLDVARISSLATLPPPEGIADVNANGRVRAGPVGPRPRQMARMGAAWAVVEAEQTSDFQSGAAGQFDVNCLASGRSSRTARRCPR